MTGDPEVLRVTFSHTQVSGSATMLSLLIGFIDALALNRLGGVSLVNTGMGVPPWWLACWS